MPSDAVAARQDLLDVVIATHQRPGGLRHLLEALEGQTLTRDRFNVVVVNDGSHDAAYEAVLRRGWGPLIYISLNRRRGPAAARNIGVRASSAAILVFTDDDCVPPHGWLAYALRRLEDQGAPDVLGGPVSPLGTGPLNLMDQYLRDIGFLQPRLGEDKPDCIPTANLALRRAWFERIGGFDELFPCPGGEDLDLILRLQAAGARSGIDLEWETAHERLASLREFCGRFFLYGYGGALRGRYSRGMLRAILPGARAARKSNATLSVEAGTRHPWPRRWAFRLLDVLRHSSYHAGAISAFTRIRIRRSRAVLSSWPMLWFVARRRIRRLAAGSGLAGASRSAASESVCRRPQVICGGLVTRSRIPRVVLQTWKSRDHLPSNYSHWSATFPALNPQYECLFWDDAANRDFISRDFPWFLPFYDAYPKEIFRADIVRFFFLFKHGGLYADMDSECLRPLDPLLKNADIVLGRMGPDPSFEHSVPNAVMASSPNQLFWLLAIAMAIERFRQASDPREMLRSGPEVLTGSVLLKNAVDYYNAVRGRQVRERASWVVHQVGGSLRPEMADIRLLDPCVWYPVDWNNPAHQVFRREILSGGVIPSLVKVRRLFPRSTLVTYWTHSW